VCVWFVYDGYWLVCDWCFTGARVCMIRLWLVLAGLWLMLYWRTCVYDSFMTGIRWSMTDALLAHVCVWFIYDWYYDWYWLVYGWCITCVWPRLFPRQTSGMLSQQTSKGKPSPGWLIRISPWGSSKLSITVWTTRCPIAQPLIRCSITFLVVYILIL
jgi:hypothetical protein